MGNSHNTNLSKDCTSFASINNATSVSFGNSLRVHMAYEKENDNKDIWAAEYEIGEILDRVVSFRLQVEHDKNGVESVKFALLGNDPDNGVDILVNIARVGGGDGLHGGIIGVRSFCSYATFRSNKQDYTIETNIVSSNCSYRDSLFVLQMKKMNYSDDIAYMATMAHYYVTKTVGLYVEATIFRNKEKSFVVKVNGPFKYQSVYLGRIIDETRRSGNWSSGGKPNNEIFEDSDSSLNSENIAVGQIVKRASNKGLINSNGYTKGSLNNSIFCTIM
ncbi:hypothetical protein QL285_056606 [Trifolium repens]|jgi:hypothetical protein|nr:hypothetical protein QL285_056606 [Trifolium repens]